jgi:hypothetical protein
MLSPREWCVNAAHSHEGLLMAIGIFARDYAFGQGDMADCVQHG